MNIAFSPCPNDTFVFHAWVHGLIPGAPELDVTYADIDITNGLAASAADRTCLKFPTRLCLGCWTNMRCCPAAALWDAAAGRLC